MKAALLLAFLSGVTAVGSDAAGSAAGEELQEGPGLSVTEAIEVCEARGQRNYLSKLVCPDNSHPTFRRVGSFGTRDPYPGDLPPEKADEILLRLIRDPTLKPGEPHFHMVDGYEVECPGRRTMIYMDMYHCGQELQPLVPPGFTLLR